MTITISFIDCTVLQDHCEFSLTNMTFGLFVIDVFKNYTKTDNCMTVNHFINLRFGVYLHIIWHISFISFIFVSKLTRRKIVI